MKKAGTLYFSKANSVIFSRMAGVLSEGSVILRDKKQGTSYKPGGAFQKDQCAYALPRHGPKFLARRPNQLQLSVIGLI